MDTIDELFEEKQVKINKSENNINLTLIHLEKIFQTVYLL